MWPFNKKKVRNPFISIVPIDVDHLASQIKHFQREMAAEKESAFKKMTDAMLREDEHTIGILKGYVVGLIFASIVAGGGVGDDVREQLNQSEDFQDVRMALQYGNWRDLPRPPADAVVKVFEEGA
jgi:hypothetical protein